MEAIARWHFPGLLALIKLVYNKRQELRKCVFNKRQLGNCHVKTLVEGNIFCDTLFHLEDVKAVKSGLVAGMSTAQILGIMPMPSGTFFGVTPSKGPRLSRPRPFRSQRAERDEFETRRTSLGFNNSYIRTVGRSRPVSYYRCARVGAFTMGRGDKWCFGGRWPSRGVPQEMEFLPVGNFSSGGRPGVVMDRQTTGVTSGLPSTLSCLDKLPDRCNDSWRRYTGQGGEISSSLVLCTEKRLGQSAGDSRFVAPKQIYSVSYFQNGDDCRRKEDPSSTWVHGPGSHPAETQRCQHSGIPRRPVGMERHSTNAQERHPRPL